MRWAWFLTWAALLASAAAILAVQLNFTTDLNAFLPDPQTVDERLLLGQLRDGAGSRFLLVELSRGTPAQRAQASRALAAELPALEIVTGVRNGGSDGVAEEAGLSRVFDYRYLLRELPPASFSADTLAQAMRARLADFTSPAGALAKDVLRADPTLESQRLLAGAGSGPALQDGVWASPDRRSALLVVETRESGFDAGAQAMVMEAVRARVPSNLRAHFAGPGAFAVTVRDDTRGDATRMSTLGSAALLILLLLVYRAPRLLVVGALPLGTAIVAGLAAVALSFGTVHGITLAFGVTLLGVALDYPIHIFSRRAPGDAPQTAIQSVWPSLRLGLLSTCLAYATLMLSGVDGLRQLGVLTVAGLLAAAAVSRWVVPGLLPDAPTIDMPRWVRGARSGVPRSLRRLGPWLPVLSACVAILWLMAAPRSATPLWQNDVAATSPVPPALIERDRRLRGWLGAPDGRHLVAARGQTAEQALQRLDAARPALKQGVADGLMTSFHAPILPSIDTQRRRQAALPMREKLAQAVAEATEELPFRASTFAPFVDAVHASRTLQPLTPDDLAGTPLEPALKQSLLQTGDGWVALALLSGLADAAQLADRLRTVDKVGVVDLKATSEGLIVRYRSRLLACLAGAALAIAALLWLAGGLGLTGQAMLPGLASVLGTAAVLNAAGVSLGLFHLISLILVAGLGLDYAIFLARERDAPARTLHAVLVCGASTTLVFGLLGLAASPVLQAIGRTVTLGVVLNLLFAWLLWLRLPDRADATPDSTGFPHV